MEKLSAEQAPQNKEAKVKEKIRDDVDDAKLSKARFRYADEYDVLFMITGVIGAAGNGILMTLLFVFFGDLVDTFSGQGGISTTNDVVDTAMLESSVNRIASRFTMLTGVGFLAGYLEVSLWTITGHRQAGRARLAYMRSLLRREIAFFDRFEAGLITTQSLQDTREMQRGLGEKVGSVIHLTCAFLSSVVVGFYLGWQLSLLILGCVPVLAASIVFLEITQKHAGKLSSDAYADAGAVAEQSISSIRTIKQCGGEGLEGEHYSRALTSAQSAAVRGGILAGCGFAIMSSTILAFFGLALWFGAWLVARGEHNGSNGSIWRAGDVITVLFAQILGAMALGQLQPPLTSVIQSGHASDKVAKEVSFKSSIDPLARDASCGPAAFKAGDSEGSLSDAACNAELQAVWFCYPSRPELAVLKGFSLHVPAGKTVALVGESGCGKSTVIQLLLRFYDPERGLVLLDGVDVSTVGVAWLRRQIGLVAQEPVLFAASIAANIAYGKSGEPVSEEEIRSAAIAANAHNFVSQFPLGYNTLCGEHGAQLSGGQKQRIAIARALVRRPRLLLLDEATSALDMSSERAVQQALDVAREGRTTLVVAHRLSTIRAADTIVALCEGTVAEYGSHSELMERGGIYAEMVRRQEGSAAEGQNNQNDGESSTDCVDSVPPDIVPGQKEISEEIYPDLEVPSPDPLISLRLDLQLPMFTRAREALAAQDTKAPTLWKLLSASYPELHWAVAGMICAAGFGTKFPLFSLLFGRATGELQAAKGRGEVSSSVGVLAGAIAGMGVGTSLFVFAQNACFTVMGERLTMRLRQRSFLSLLKRRVGYFDLPAHGPAALCSRLATEAAEVHGAGAERLGLLTQNLMTVLMGAIIALVASWKLGLVVLACVPLMTVGASIENRLCRGGFELLGSDEASELLGQAILHARIVAAYGLEASMLSECAARLERVTTRGIRRAHISGVAYGFSQGIQYAIFGLGFWYGGQLLLQGHWDRPSSFWAGDCESLISEGYYTSEQLCVKVLNLSYGFGRFMECFWSVFLGCRAVGEALSFAPDSAKALSASARIFQLIEAPPEESEDVENLQAAPPVVGQDGPANTLLDTQCQGDIEYRNIWFRYPMRPGSPVLRGFSLHVPAGKTVALVGESGCGKSTVIQLLLRFYDPERGLVLLDGVDVSTVGVAWLRRQIGLVAQEPVLFSSTIGFNIAYGRLWDKPCQQEIEDAARAADALDFISSFPQGFDTLCGERGAQLSGGQKQRIAIARALVRSPRLLVLDEATSALDVASEQTVHQLARKGQTTLVVAQRLSTIRTADIIVGIKVP